MKAAIEPQMHLDTIIPELEADFQIVDINLPSGQTVKCVKQASILIPIAKVIVYGMGRSLFTIEEMTELEQLKQARRMNQRVFSKSDKPNRLRDLQRRQDNYKKSLENLKALEDGGLSNSAEDIKKLITHLLDLGDKITTSTASAEMVRSQLESPRGMLTILTGWKMVEDDIKYMTTIHFLPPKQA